jgi:cell division protease FtsH
VSDRGPASGAPALKRSRSSFGARLSNGLTTAFDFLRAAIKIVAKDPLDGILLGGTIALTILFFSLLGSIQPSSPGTEVPLSSVAKATEQKQLKTATLLDEDARVVVETKLGNTYWAAYPSSDAQTNGLVRTLTNEGVVVDVDQQSWVPTRRIVVQFLLPILILVCLFAYFMRIGQDSMAGGFAAFSKLGNRRRKKARRPITFADVAGASESVSELREIRDYLADPTKYSRLGARAPKGVLLVGPPGTGKTLLAKATSGEADAAFFSMSGSEFVESLVGVGAARVRDLFAQARKVAPAIVFIDELDAAGRRRGAGIGQGNDEREQTLNQLLVEMDGFEAEAGLVVMGATNRPDILDPALLRPGRFDRQVTIDPPDVHGRFEILELHCGSRPLAPDTSLLEIAKLTPGFTGADLANVINEASLLTVREQRTEITQAILEESIDRVVAGPAKKSHVLSEDEQYVIAVHEASHAVVTRSIGQAVSAQKLSIVARGRQLGTAAHMLTDRDVLIQQETDLWRQLVAIVSGAAGEHVEYGFFSTGIHDDLHAATQLARRMVTSFGMSAELGPVTIGEREGEVFLGASLQDLGSVGPATLELIDREVERLVGEAIDKAVSVLERNWAAVEETANALIEHETLSGVALDAVLSTVQPMPIAEPQRNGRFNRRRPSREG